MLWNNISVKTNILNVFIIYFIFYLIDKYTLALNLEFTVYGNMHMRDTKIHGIFIEKISPEEIRNYL